MGGIKPELVAKAYQNLIEVGPEDIKPGKSIEEFRKKLITPENERSYNSKFLQINRYATAGRDGRELSQLADEFLIECKIPKECIKILKRFGKKK